MTININGRLLSFDTPKIMGIVNVTPDSFYDGNPNQTLEDVLDKVEKMILQGVDIIDIGGYSSRPGADDIPVDEEFKRVIPVIEKVVEKFSDVIISVDTFRSKVAKEAINAGASIINDISAGGLDSKMYDTVAELNVPYVIMHMIGTPQNMQDKLIYKKDVLIEIQKYFSEKISVLRNKGINDIIIDPGFGFSKTLDQNYYILRKLDLLRNFKLPILIGISRKSMLYKPLKIGPKSSLNSSTAAHMIALANGANILRVHDVKEAKEVTRIFKLIYPF